MNMYITWGRVKPGRWNEYERLFLRADPAALGMTVPRVRWLLQDLDDADTGFAISLWDSAESVQQFVADPVIREMRARNFVEVFVGEYERHECEVRVSSPGALQHLSYPAAADPVSGQSAATPPNLRGAP